MPTVSTWAAATRSSTPSALSGNPAMRESIAAAIARRLPTYAECGGLLYLSRIADRCGRRSVADGRRGATRARMHRRLQRMGYREGILADCLLGTAGTRLRGHEFHYSSCRTGRKNPRPPICWMVSPEGYCRGNLFASYLHLHLPDARRWSPTG